MNILPQLMLGINDKTNLTANSSLEFELHANYWIWWLP